MAKIENEPIHNCTNWFKVIDNPVYKAIRWNQGTKRLETEINNPLDPYGSALAVANSVSLAETNA